MCGHYDCGGVRASLKSQDLGTMENWVRNVRDVVRLHQVRLMWLCTVGGNVDGPNCTDVVVVVVVVVTCDGKGGV